MTTPTEDLLARALERQQKLTEQWKARAEALETGLREFNRCPCWSGALCDRCSLRLAHLITKAECAALSAPEVKT